MGAGKEEKETQTAMGFQRLFAFASRRRRAIGRGCPRVSLGPTGSGAASSWLPAARPLLAVTERGREQRAWVRIHALKAWMIEDLFLAPLLARTGKKRDEQPWPASTRYAPRLNVSGSQLLPA